MANAKLPNRPGFALLQGGIPHEGEKYDVCAPGAERHRTVTQVRLSPSCSQRAPNLPEFAPPAAGRSSAAGFSTSGREFV